MKAVSVAYSGVIFHGMLKNYRHSLKSEIDYAGCFEMRGGKTDGASSPLVDESRHRLLSSRRVRDGSSLLDKRLTIDRIVHKSQSRES